MSAELTRDSRKALKNAYDLYCERRNDGQSKSVATYFADPKWGGGPTIVGMEDAKSELSNAGFIKCDIVGGCTLLDKTIIFMENFTKDSILKWLELGSKFIP